MRVKALKFKSGFTLIELLVCIAIIAILAAILIPTIGKIRQSARITQSLSNVRHIATAMRMFANDHNGKYPPGYYYKPGEGERIWTIEILPYIDQKTGSNESSRNVFVSPLVDLEIKEGDLDQGILPNTYSAHGVLVPNISNEDTRIPVWNLIEPSSLILVGEATLRSNNSYANASFNNPRAFRVKNTGDDLNEPIPIDTDEDGIGGSLRYRANGAVPVAFADGHVEAMEKGTVTYRNIVVRN